MAAARNEALGNLRVDSSDVDHNHVDNDPRLHHARRGSVPRRHKPDRRKSAKGTLRGAAGLRTLACRVANMTKLPLTLCAHEAATRAGLTNAELRLALREGDMFPEVEKVRLEARGIVVVLSCTSAMIVTCWRVAIGPFDVDDVLEVGDV